MTDKPKTLGEQLIELAEWLEDDAYKWSEDSHYNRAREVTAKAEEVRVIAESLRGCVVAPVAYRGYEGAELYWAVWIEESAAGQVGVGPDVRVGTAHLQSLLDQQKG